MMWCGENGSVHSGLTCAERPAAKSSASGEKRRSREAGIFRIIGEVGCYIVCSGFAVSSKHFSGAVAVDRVSFSARPGSALLAVAAVCARLRTRSADAALVFEEVPSWKLTTLELP
jgi:hypothetical protein